MIYDIETRIVYISYDKNAGIMVTIRSIDFNTTPIINKLIYGATFIVGHSETHNDTLIKAKDIKNKLDNIICDFKKLPLSESRINELTLTLVRELSHLKEATE